jgi:hypothetical protein
MERALFELCSEAVSTGFLGLGNSQQLSLHLYSMTRLRSRHWGRCCTNLRIYMPKNICSSLWNWDSGRTEALTRSTRRRLVVNPALLQGGSESPGMENFRFPLRLTTLNI